MSLRPLAGGGGAVGQQVDPKKRHFFVIEKYVDDVKQNEKHVPDLLEAIMEGSGLVKEELRPILFKLSQFRLEITKIRVCTFQMSGKIPDSSRTSPRASLSAIIWPRYRPNIRKKTGFGPFGTGYPSLFFATRRHACVEKSI